MKIEGSVWFTPMQASSVIGIVVGDNGFEKKAYIGIGTGKDQKSDEELIAKRGTPFPIAIAKQLI